MRHNKPETVITEYSDSLVLKVFADKCNACHIKKKQIVFTKDNLVVNKLSNEDQVFVKERMPKGKNYTLTKAEKSILQDRVSKGKL